MWGETDTDQLAARRCTVKERDRSIWDAEGIGARVERRGVRASAVRRLRHSDDQDTVVRAAHHRGPRAGPDKDLHAHHDVAVDRITREASPALGHRRSPRRRREELRRHRALRLAASRHERRRPDQPVGCSGATDGRRDRAARAGRSGSCQRDPQGVAGIGPTGGAGGSHERGALFEHPLDHGSSSCGDRLGFVGCRPLVAHVAPRECWVLDGTARPDRMSPGLALQRERSASQQ